MSEQKDSEMKFDTGSSGIAVTILEEQENKFKQRFSLQDQIAHNLNKIIHSLEAALQHEQSKNSILHQLLVAQRTQIANSEALKNEFEESCNTLEKMHDTLKGLLTSQENETAYWKEKYGILEEIVGLLRKETIEDDSSFDCDKEDKNNSCLRSDSPILRSNHLPDTEDTEDADCALNMNQ